MGNHLGPGTDTFVFGLEDDHRVSVPRTSWHQGSRWESRDSQSIRFSFAKGRATYEGRLGNEDTMAGAGHDRYGRAQDWEARRIRKATTTPASPENSPATDAAGFSGTTWKIIDSNGKTETYRFNDDHTVTAAGREKLRWSSPDERSLRFSFNNDFAKLEGRLVEPETMVGTAGTGRFTWEWMARRIDSDDRE